MKRFGLLTEKWQSKTSRVFHDGKARAYCTAMYVPIKVPLPLLGGGGNSGPIPHMVPWVHSIPHPKRHLDQFSHLCKHMVVTNIYTHCTDIGVDTDNEKQIDDCFVMYHRSPSRGTI